MDDSQKLNEFLNKNLLSKTQLAEMIGVSKTTIVSISNGKSPLTKKVKRKILDVFPDFDKALDSYVVKGTEKESFDKEIIYDKQVKYSSKTEEINIIKELLNQNRELITQNGKLIEMLSGKDTIKKNPDTSIEGERLGKKEEEAQFPTAA